MQLGLFITFASLQKYMIQYHWYLLGSRSKWSYAKNFRLSVNWTTATSLCNHFQHNFVHDYDFSRGSNLFNPSELYRKVENLARNQERPFSTTKGFTVWLIYGAEFLGVIVFRFRKDTKDIKRPYKVPLVIAFFCLGVSLFMTLTPIISDPAIGYLGTVV